MLLYTKKKISCEQNSLDSSTSVNSYLQQCEYHTMKKMCFNLDVFIISLKPLCQLVSLPFVILIISLQIFLIHMKWLFTSNYIMVLTYIKIKWICQYLVYHIEFTKRSSPCKSYQINLTHTIFKYISNSQKVIFPSQNCSDMHYY